MSPRRILSLSCSLFFLIALARADPQPGDTYREYGWVPAGKGARARWERITGPDATNARARRFLPNPVNRIDIADLEGAIRAELQLELLQTHVGTIGQAFRLNGGEWHAIPPSPNIPGTIGTDKEGDPHHWQSMRYPSVPVPLAALHVGGNTLEFTCKAGFGLGKNWPQSLVNGALLRVYYGAGKTTITGQIEASGPSDPATAGVRLRFIPEPASANAVVRVDFIGHYRGFDWRGEGRYESWHYNYRRGELAHHLGSAWQAPWAADWDTTWLPVQPEPVAIAARVTDATGLHHLTASFTLDDPRQPANEKVELLEPHAVPPKWHTRAGRRQSCKVRFPDDLSGLREVRVLLTTWNGHAADAIGINDCVIAGNVGRNHDLSYDVLTVPLGAVRPGENEFFTFSDEKEGHGIEVQWPGFVVLARFATGTGESESTAGQ